MLMKITSKANVHFHDHIHYSNNKSNLEIAFNVNSRNERRAYAFVKARMDLKVIEFNKNQETRKVPLTTSQVCTNF